MALLTADPSQQVTVGFPAAMVDKSNAPTTRLVPAFTVVDSSGAPAGSSISPASGIVFASPTGGFTDTADHAVMAAAAGLRNYLTGLQFANTGTASEIVIKDGASTVLWRGYALATTGAMSTLSFSPPLRGSVNTAMNVAMITTASATRVSAQGYQAT